MNDIFGGGGDTESKLSEIIDHNDPRALLNAFGNQNYKPQTKNSETMSKSKSE